MSSASIYEKLSAVSNKQVAVTTRQELIEAITGLGGITLDSSWQDVPVIYSNPSYNAIASQVSTSLRNRNQQVTPVNVQLQIDTAINSLNTASAAKAAQVAAVQAIISALQRFASGSLTQAATDAAVTQAFSTYLDDSPQTFTPVTSTAGVTTPFVVPQSPLKGTFDFDFDTGLGGTPSANFPASVTVFPLNPTDATTVASALLGSSVLGAINQQISNIASQVASLQTTRANVTATLQSDTTQFNILRKNTTDQLTAKMGAVSRSIEFYDAVVSS